MKKAVCLLSGGPDSATVAAMARGEGYDLHCLTFDYGQLGVKEIEGAKKLATYFRAKEHRILDISFLKGLFGRGSSSLLDEGMPMPREFERSLIVPFRNGIMLSIAVGYAATVGAEVVFYGAHGGDAPFYPDCRGEFVSAMERAAVLGTEVGLKIRNPISKLSKAEVIKIGKELGVPLELTWSCYLSRARHCGKCESCVNRKRAFEAAGVPDPTLYER